MGAGCFSGGTGPVFVGTLGIVLSVSDVDGVCFPGTGV